MKRSMYNIVIAPAIVMVITLLIAYYSVGVIEKNAAWQTSEKHISGIISDIEKRDEEFESICSSFRDEYEAKAMTISLILSHTPRALSEDMAAEELLAAIGADELFLSDKYGNISFSTSSIEKGLKVREEFKDGTSIKNYKNTVTEKSGKDLIFEVAVSRRDKTGLVIIRFRNTAAASLTDYGDLADQSQISTVFPSGSCAIINSDSMEYLSHSSGTMTGRTCQIPEEYFSREKKYFSYSVSGTSSLVCFEHYKNNIIIDVLPKDEVYAGRNMLLIWLCILAAAALISIVLSIRDHLLALSADSNDNNENNI